MLRFDFSQIKANLVQGSSYGFRTKMKKINFLNREPKTKHREDRLEQYMIVYSTSNTLIMQSVH